jgi:hypothetical protein
LLASFWLLFLYSHHHLLFFFLLSKNWKSKVVKLNEIVQEANAKERGSRIRPFTEREFLICLGIMVAAPGFNCRGSELWAKDNTGTPGADPKTWQTIMISPNFGQYLGESRFKEFQKLIPRLWENPTAKESDPWWEFSAAVKEFNKQRRDLIRASSWKVEDESMSAWCPRKTKTGGLPNISFIIRKPEPLGNYMFVCFLFCISFPITHLFVVFYPSGTELKNIACCKIGCMLALELQHGKEGMRLEQYYDTLGATAAYTL